MDWTDVPVVCLDRVVQTLFLGAARQADFEDRFAGRGEREALALLRDQHLSDLLLELP